MINFDAYLGNYHYRYFNRANWMLVFYHNITGRVYFDNESEAEHTLNSNQKYSIFTELTPNLKFDNKYEFLIQWGNSDRLYNQWKQDNNPIDEYEVEGQHYVQGFEPIHLDYNSTDSFAFGGLAKTLIPSTINESGKIMSYNMSLIKGTPGDSFWYFALGQYNIQNTNWEENVPTTTDNETVVHLWVRISPHFYHIYATKCSCFNRIPLHLLVISLLYSKVSM